jgi:hypothetical protein
MIYEIWWKKNPSLLTYQNNAVGRVNKKQEMNYSCKIGKDIST